MISSEMGTEDMELSDILEKEYMDLNSMVEQWKQTGMEHVPEEEIDRINYFSLSRQDVDLQGLKRSHGATKNLGVSAQGLHLTNNNVKHRKNKRMQNE